MSFELISMKCPGCKNLLDPYKETIDECMYPDVYSNKSIQISKARKAISNYSKAVGDILGEAVLMVFPWNAVTISR